METTLLRDSMFKPLHQAPEWNPEWMKPGPYKPGVSDVAVHKDLSPSLALIRSIFFWKSSVWRAGWLSYDVIYVSSNFQFTPFGQYGKNWACGC